MTIGIIRSVCSIWSARHPGLRAWVSWVIFVWSLGVVQGGLGLGGRGAPVHCPLGLLGRFLLLSAGLPTCGGSHDR